MILWRLPVSPGPPGGPALVIAPHPDDESLGCGGMVARLIGAGEAVCVVIVTDGARANRAAMAQAEAAGVDLPAMRRSEAVEACSRLGVDEKDVHFLDIPDGGVSARVDRLVSLLSALMVDLGPAIVLHPDERDGHPDHAAVGRAVASAARGGGRVVWLYGYQVWLWHSWPWTGQSWRRARLWPANGRRALRCLLWILSGRTVQVQLAPTELKRKTDAIEAHRSQVSVPQWATRWAVLGDIAEGDFLERFLRPVEIYKVRRVG